MAKVIVTSWINPEENGYNSDERPKSIERISSSIEDLIEFVKESEMKGFLADRIEFAKTTLPFYKEQFLEDDEINKYWDGDGFKYLKSCLERNELGRCVARMWNTRRAEKCKAANREVKYNYLLFQVRNLH